MKPYSGVLAGGALLFAVASGAISCRPEFTATEAWPERIEITLARHQEVRVLPDGSLLPRFLGPESKIRLCFHTPTTLDTSQWKGRLVWPGYRSPGKEFSDPERRLVDTLCFSSTLPGDLGDGAEAEVHAEIRDTARDKTYSSPGRALVFDRDDTEWKNLNQRVYAAFDATLSFQDRLDRLYDLEHQADQTRFPLLRTWIQMSRAHFLSTDGSEKSLGELDKLLTRLPAWLVRPEAAEWGSQARLQKARLEVRQNRHLREPWQTLREAEKQADLIASDIRVAIRERMAFIQARIGVLPEAIESLQKTIAACDHVKCHKIYLVSARATLAWLVFLDSEATTEDLATSAADLEELLLDPDASSDPAEVANQWINLALLQQRLGRDSDLALTRARELLTITDAGEIRGRELAVWSDFVEARAALESEKPERALEICRRHLADSRLVQEPAWAFSCTGRAYRALGRLQEARRLFEEALFQHKAFFAGGLGQDVSLSPGQRASDFYRAVRVEVELGNLEEAWDLLALLDALSIAEVSELECRTSGPKSSISSPRAPAVAELLADLETLEAPAAGARRLQRETSRRSLMERLREHYRLRMACAELPETSADSPVDFRAVPLEDEILVLRSESDGVIVLDHRAEIPAAELRGHLKALREALKTPEIGNGVWRELASPLAEALIPADPDRLDPITTFALHGSLQEAPLAALPLADGTGSENAWLSDRTLVVVRPAGARGAAQKPPTGAVPLFVVDPLGDLRTASEMLDTYRLLEPEALFLHREEATIGAFEGLFRRASWLHVDTHGSFDPAFPELSSLAFHDRELRMFELAEIPQGLAFANLSGCHTGSWPITADSGRYGIAGFLARRGVPWVVASRALLLDRLAGAFNKTFYDRLSQGAEVTEAYSHALAVVKGEYPASAWGALLLLGGQKSPSGTPFPAEGR